MDTAVSLVQAYLRVNGYFTVSEYPVLEATRSSHQMATDLDVLGFRFPGAGRAVSGRPAGTWRFEPDPRLGCPPGRADMLIGEVKEGRARLNPAIRDPEVLGVALTRFGCCTAEDQGQLITSLLRHGHATTRAGHLVRFVAFGSGTTAPPDVHTAVDLAHVVRFLRAYLRDHWDVLRHAEFKDPTLGFLAMLEKAPGTERRKRRRSHEEAR